MIRAVIDTSILIRSILKPKGSTGFILEQLKAHRFQIVYSEPLLAELADVLTRPRFRDKYGISAEDVSNVVTLFASEGEAVRSSVTVEACRDPKDNKVLEATLAGRAHVIVTGDDDLFVLHPFEGIQIIGPAAFLARLRHPEQDHRNETPRTRTRIGSAAGFQARRSSIGRSGLLAGGRNLNCAAVRLYVLKEMIIDCLA
jgi:putative PIN family toxin of toxin-antitoxin system